MRRRLLAVQGPLQYITGYIAYRWSEPPSPDVEDVLVLYDFLASPRIEHEIAEAVRALSSTGRWARVVYISGAQMDRLMRRTYSRSIKGLHALIGSSRFDDIYLARDHVGNGSPLLLNAYPDARKVSYGDSLGIVGQREAFEALDPPLSFKGRLRAALRRQLLGTPADIGFDEAVLTLPIDMSGKYLQGMALTVPSRDHVVATLKEIYGAVPALASYCRSLCAEGIPGKSHLYLLSNLTASGVSDAKREQALYLEIITATSPEGGTVYLKPHPRSTFDVMSALVKALEGRYRVVVVDDDQFARFPIELWLDLIRQCEVVAMFSTSAINLKYLFAKEVTMPLTEANIARYFNPSTVSHIDSTYRMIRGSLANLETWDGTGALWSAAR